MMNKTQNVAQINNLHDIRYEKMKLKQMINKQEKCIQDDWDEIYNFWSFVPRITKVAQNAIKVIPFSFNIISTILGLFSSKKSK